MKSDDASFKVPTEKQSAEVKGTTNTKEQEPTGEQRRLVYDRLIKPIFEQVDDEHAFTCVKAVQFFSKKQAEEHERNVPAPRMPSGVLITRKKDPSELGVATLSVPEVYKDYLCFKRVLNPLMQRELPDSTEKDSALLSLVSKHLWVRNLEGVRRLIREGKINEKEIEGTLSFAKKQEQWIRDATDMEAKLESGALDEKNRFPAGTMQKMIDTWSAYFWTVEDLHNDRSTYVMHVEDLVRGRAGRTERIAGSAKTIHEALEGIRKLGPRLVAAGINAGPDEDGAFLEKEREAMTPEGREIASKPEFYHAIGAEHFSFMPSLTEKDWKTALQRAGIPATTHDRLLAVFRKEEK